MSPIGHKGGAASTIVQALSHASHLSKIVIVIVAIAMVWLSLLTAYALYYIPRLQANVDDPAPVKSLKIGGWILQDTTTDDQRPAIPALKIFYNDGTASSNPQSVVMLPGMEMANWRITTQNASTLETSGMDGHDPWNLIVEDTAGDWGTYRFVNQAFQAYDSGSNAYQTIWPLS